MIWMQTGSGRAVDLVAPNAAMIDLNRDMPEALARTPRFIGHVRAGPYSVAQHCVLGAECLFQQTSRQDLAAAFLLHDGHEAYMGDIATPVAQALAALAGTDAMVHKDHRGDGTAIVERAIKALKRNLDIAIHAAAGITYPLPEATREAVKRMDRAMFAIEHQQLMGPAPLPLDPEWHLAPLPRLSRRITVWSWPNAADAWRGALHRYLPDLGRRAA